MVADLWGIQDVAQLLGGGSRNRAFRAAQRPDFPPPIATVGHTRIWAAPDVRGWWAERQPPEHGLVAYNRRGCRCDVCRAARAAYVREYKAARAD